VNDKDATVDTWLPTGNLSDVLELNITICIAIAVGQHTDLVGSRTRCKRYMLCEVSYHSIILLTCSVCDVLVSIILATPSPSCFHTPHPPVPPSSRTLSWSMHIQPSDPVAPKILYEKEKLKIFQDAYS